MKFTRVFSKSFTWPFGYKKSAPKKTKEAQTAKVNSSSSNDNAGGEECCDIIEWELRPGGMLVQKRKSALGVSPSSGPLIKVKVSHGLYQHDITIPAHATFGDLKWILADEIGLQPHEQRIIFQGKEKDNNEFLHIAGVKHLAKVILVEDPATKEKKLEEMKKDDNVGGACQAVAKVRTEVDMLAAKVSALDGIVRSGGKISDHDFNLLSELLRAQLLGLNAISAEGEAKVQRQIEVRRIHNITEQLEGVKIRHGNPFSNNVVVITTQWETFDSGCGPAPTTMTTNWEVF